MIHLINKSKICFPDFNKRVHYDNDLHNYCNDRRIIVHETEMIDDLGQYRHRNERPFILLHKYLDNKHKTWVFSHEIGHDMFHSPLSCKFTVDLRIKIEKEANIVAAILMIPKELLIFMTDWEICHEFNYPRKLVEFRRRIFNDSVGEI